MTSSFSSISDSSPIRQILYLPNLLPKAHVDPRHARHNPWYCPLLLPKPNKWYSSSSWSQGREKIEGVQLLRACSFRNGRNALELIIPREFNVPPPGAWSDMHLLDPPPRWLGCCGLLVEIQEGVARVEASTLLQKLRLECTKFCEDGVTLGMVVDEAREHFRRHEHSSHVYIKCSGWEN